MDFDKGEIYMIRNKCNGLSYVGQVVKYSGKDNRKRGRFVRWKTHVREAMKGGTSSPYLYNAIRKYGNESFSIILLCEAHVSELNYFETFFIREIGCLYPNGYNMNDGGDTKIDTEETKEKKRQSHANYKPSSEAIKRSRIGQLGLRRNDLNITLPEFVYSKRNRNTDPVYYYVKFYVDTSFTKRIYRQFQTLKEANDFVEQCKQTYADVVVEIEKIRNRYSLQKISINSTKDVTLPENVYHLHMDSKLIGYIVDGLKDSDGDPIPPKQFLGNQNKWNLVHAINYIETMNTIHQSSYNIKDINNIDVNVRRTKKGIKEDYLPRYVLRVFDRNTKEHIGYCIDSFPIVKDGQIKRYNKHFAKKKMTLEEKYDLTIEHLNKLKDCVLEKSGS